MATVEIRLDSLIGKKITAEDRHITLKEVSRETGISHNRLIEFRKNKARAIKLSTIAVLCHYFGCQPGDLFAFTPPGLIISISANPDNIVAVPLPPRLTDSRVEYQTSTDAGGLNYGKRS